MDALLVLVLIPAAAAVIAWIVLMQSALATRRELSANRVSSAMRPIVIACAVVAAPVVLGVVLWWIVAPIVDTFYGPERYAPSEAVLLDAATVAYGCAALSSTLSAVLVFRGRMRAMLSTDLGRVLPVALIAFTGVVFAQVIGIRLVAVLSAQLHGLVIIDITTIPSATTAFQAFTLALVAFPVAAWFSNKVKYLSGRGFALALIVMEAGEIPVLLGLVQSLLAIEALRGP